MKTKSIDILLLCIQFEIRTVFSEKLKLDFFFEANSVKRSDLHTWRNKPEFEHSQKDFESNIFCELYLCTDLFFLQVSRLLVFNAQTLLIAIAITTIFTLS